MPEIAVRITVAVVRVRRRHVREGGAAAVFNGRGIIVAHVCATSMYAQNHWTGDDAVVAV
eukprot:CAMPEP_0194313522 /NCGR_PEP_ID=MMETSP0171-20130528/10406_1 /TAXON_ID=218684 /ORGANISM="Corethron pennatum, Strain L29A3" /LENGTH=59 /DNA_ID=CAMNT_0039068531 /DNA_START=140 /DNA_END=315 /DNA_ORIENTATION=+